MPRGKVIVKGVECLTCGKRFSGRRNAVAHARSNEHYRFKNVKLTRERVNPETYRER
jgi:hypothetical protein